MKPGPVSPVTGTVSRTRKGNSGGCWAVAAKTAQRSVMCAKSSPGRLLGSIGLLLPQSVLVRKRRDQFHRDAGGEGAVEQKLEGAAAVGAGLQRPAVDVHPHELVPELAGHTAAELHGVLERFGAMVERVADAALEHAGDLCDALRCQVAPDGVAAERDGQAGFLCPPGAEVENFFQAGAGISQLAFVNEHAG